MSRGNRGGWAGFALLAGYCAWLVLPLVWVAYSSLKSDAAIFNDALALPSASDLHLSNYSRAWTGSGLGHYFLNSVGVTVASVGLILGAGACAAYALARLTHPFGRVLFAVVIAGLAIPAQLAVIPLFFEMRALGLLNSRLGLVLVYAANGIPFSVLVLTGFFRTVPRALHEAAVMDGCGERLAFTRIFLPLCRPALATVAIFQFIGVWKEYFYAYMLVGGDPSGSARTMPLALANLSIAAEYRTEYGTLFAGIVIVTLPLLAVYLFLQRRIVGGVAAGALKG